MKKLNFRILTIFSLLILSISQLQASDPIKISYKPSNVVYMGHRFYRLTITSLEDKITIKNVILNRGNNCTLNSSLANGSELKFPQKLSYGNNISGLVICANLINIKISTDQGDFEYNID